MAFTGMRFAEVCGLSVKDIDFESGAVSVSQQLLSGKIKQPKTKNGIRTIKFVPESTYMKKLKIRVLKKPHFSKKKKFALFPRLFLFFLFFF